MMNEQEITVDDVEALRCAASIQRAAIVSGALKSPIAFFNLNINKSAKTAQVFCSAISLQRLCLQVIQDESVNMPDEGLKDRVVSLVEQNQPEKLKQKMADLSDGYLNKPVAQRNHKMVPLSRLGYLYCLMLGHYQLALTLMQSADFTSGSRAVHAAEYTARFGSPDLMSELLRTHSKVFATSSMLNSLNKIAEKNGDYTMQKAIMDFAN